MKRQGHFEEHCRHMRESVTLDEYPSIEGWNFEKKFDFQQFINKYFNTGFQATHLGKAVQIVNKMIADKAVIYLCMSGNAISSGLRDIIKYLVKHKKIHGIVTTGAGVEEDIIKCFKPFVVGDFDIPGKLLFDKGVGRIGNILAPFDRYLYFEEFIDPFLEQMYKKQQKLGRPLTGLEFTRELGLAINNEDSYLYWAAKNDIPVYCPAPQDGTLGDLMYFLKKRRKDFTLDLIDDMRVLNDFTLQEKKMGAIVLGGGVAKHYLLNSTILREGYDYAVYLTTAEESDGSDSGGNEEEAKTWAKINVNAPTAKVKADFTLTFPLLVAATFAQPKPRKNVK